MKKPVILLLLSILFVFPTLNAQEEEESSQDKVKTGFNLSGVPAVAYDSDIGFLYGIILNLYHYGDGTRYPKYNHSIYMEWTNTTKGSMKSILRYDSDRLIPGIRTSAEFSYNTEQALDFYGFNGYEALYDATYEDDTHGDYLSRLFYRMDRKTLLLRTDFTGDIIEDKLHWFAGFEFRNMQIDSVNTTKLNDGKSPEDQLPTDVNGGLYGKYSNEWGIIPADQINGGTNTLLKVGLIYDTRDNEPNPMKGIWTEAQLIWSPSFLGSNSPSYGRFVLTHRQYFTIVPEDLNFVYRLSYQGKIGGQMPYYMLPFVFNSPPSWTRDGMGGSKTMRGILRNRVVGEDYFLANIEARWKFVYFQLFGQNFYLALSGFMDAGLVTGKYPVDISGVPADMLHFFPDEKESLHTSAGGGLHIAWNRNFIIAIDYGRALDKRDGLSGLYIGLDFLF
jgi:outer membrane protein assembly factor BamA